MKRFLIPLGIFLVLVVFLAIGLNRDPHEVPSPLVGKPAPEFRLEQLGAAGKTFSPADMRGQVWLLNVWASWCVSCRAEHPLLVAFAKQGGVPIVGLNYKEVRGDGETDVKKLAAGAEASLGRLPRLEGEAHRGVGRQLAPDGTDLADERSVDRHAGDGLVEPALDGRGR